MQLEVYTVIVSMGEVGSYRFAGKEFSSICFVSSFFPLFSHSSLSSLFLSLFLSLSPLSSLSSRAVACLITVTRS